MRRWIVGVVLLAGWIGAAGCSGGGTGDEKRVMRDGREVIVVDHTDRPAEECYSCKMHAE